MCGITGAVWTSPQTALSQQLLRQMTAVLRHRGPDDEGYYWQPLSRDRNVGVALGHRRLSIIDLQTGHQPMSNEDYTVWVVFNGEIYNYKQLRRNLEQAGHRFRTQSDTEVLIHLYEHCGPAMVTQLNGMFAFAIWDERRQRLFVARDRLGQKPLYYYTDNERFVFASELKSLALVPDLCKQVDPCSIDLFLTYQYIPHPRTIYRDVFKLAPGYCGIWTKGRWKSWAYWHPDFNRLQFLDKKEWSERLRELLESAVQLRLQSDVPLGAFLSGGIDSTTIVGLMQKLSPEPTRTFSIGFPVRQYDETSYARAVARRFRTYHKEFRVEPNAMVVLPQLIWHFDEPFADSSAIPTWYVAKLTRDYVKVALTGDGGDELFVGYPRYKAVWLAAAIDGFLPLVKRGLTGGLSRLLPNSAVYKSPVRRLKRFLEPLHLPPLARYLVWIAIFSDQQRQVLYSAGFLRNLGENKPLEFLEQYFKQASKRDVVSAISHTDLVTYLPCDLMCKVDITSMAHGLECRQPFLDVRIVELAASMPLELKFSWGRGKRILTETFKDLIPASVRRRSKMGFGVPLDQWLRGKLGVFAKNTLLERRTIERGYFRRETVARLLEEHISAKADHSYRIWALLILELWHRSWLESDWSWSEQLHALHATGKVATPSACVKQQEDSRAQS